MGGGHLVVTMVIWGEQSMEQGEIVAGKPQDQPVILPGTASTGLDNNETMTTELKIEFRHDYRNREVGGAGYH